MTWIRILGSTFGKSGSGSSDPPFRNSGSGSSDPHLEKVDPDPVPKWIRIRIRVPIFHIFHKEIHVGQITMLILLPPKFRKGISQITKHLVLLFTLNSFGATRIQINAFLSGSGSVSEERNRSGSGSGAGIEVDPDPTKCSGSGWIWIRIRIRNAGLYNKKY